MTTVCRPDDVLLELLRDEHAAIYAYGVLGAHLAGHQLALARAAFDAHRAARDGLRSRLVAAHQEAPGAEAAYDLRVASAAEALSLALHVEEHLAVLWRDLLTSGPSRDVRVSAVQALQDCAVRAAQWRKASGLAPTVPFPGAT